jgi:hypothetical protein
MMRPLSNTPDHGPSKTGATDFDVEDYGFGPLLLDGDPPPTATLAAPPLPVPDPPALPPSVDFPLESVSVTTEANVATQTPSPLPAPSPKFHWTFRNVRGAIWFGIKTAVSTLFGIASLILMLAVVAAVPGANFYALGYLLEVEGRVARSGRFRDAFPLLNLAPKLGTIALGIWLWLIPLRLLADAATDARLIAPGAGPDRFLHGLVNVLWVLITAHICLALARGGSLSCFFRPIKNVRWLRERFRSHDYWSTAERAVVDFVTGLRIRHHWWLGVRGFVGALVWLVPPTLLLSALRRTEPGPAIVTIAGGLLLSVVLSWVPFLQARFAAEGRFRAMFELRAVREMYRHAPFSWLFTMLITLVLALPLYLFKVALPPQDMMWLVTLIFIVSIYPAKVLTGWAYHRAKHREKRTFWLLRYGVWLVLQPLLMFYVFLLFFTQYIGKYGKLVLFEHHAFLLPVPF